MAAHFDIIAIGTSAGGLQALQHVLGQLPVDLAVPVLVVQHLDPRHRSLLTEIMGRHTDLEVRQAEEGDQVVPGHVYFAPPAHHLVVEPGGMLRLTESPAVRFARPSVDVLFQSVARTYGDRSIAVILTGSGSDGAAGVTAMNDVGGTVIAEDEASAEFSGMPHAATATGDVDMVLPLDEIAGALVRLTMPGQDVTP